MVGLRVVLCPVIVWDARQSWSGTLLALIAVIALVDDKDDAVSVEPERSTYCGATVRVIWVIPV
jgi:hypothetical protein